jgi:hypothetical protein
MVDQPARPIRPIVIKIKKGKKKRRYSRGLGDLQKSARGFSKISTRAARSMFQGVDTLFKASDKSALKKRDGALRDLGKNLGKAASKALRVSSRIPADVGKVLSTGTSRRVVRRQIRLISRMNRRFGMR